MSAIIDVMDALETERLILRAWNSSDIDDYVRIFTKPETTQFPFGRALSHEEAQASGTAHVSAHARGDIDPWAAIDKTTGRVIGWIGLSYGADYPEYLTRLQVGWRLDPEYWGRGLATEGGAASVRYAFEHFDLEQILVFAQPDNVASIQVGKRLGGRFEGETYASIPGIPEPIPHVIYTIDKSRSV